MFEVKFAAPEHDPMAVEQQCPAMLQLRVRVVECCLHRGVAGVKVRLRRGDKQLGPFDTDANGRVTFNVAREHVTGDPGIHVKFQLPEGGQYAFKEAAHAEWMAAPMQPEQNTLAQLTLASHWVTPPGDLNARVKSVLSNADVRVYVDDGANYGNQAACLDFLRALDRIEKTPATTPEPKPLVRVLAKSDAEYEEYTHTLRMQLPDLGKATKQNLKAFWSAYLPAVIHGLTEIDEDSEDEGFFLDDTCKQATIRLQRACAPTQVNATDEEDAADAEDDINHFETTQLHLKYVLKGLLAHAAVTALDPGKISLYTDATKKTVLGGLGGNLALQLTVMSCEEPSPAARLRRLEPNLANVRAGTVSLAKAGDLADEERANLIGVLPAFDLGESLPKPERDKINELATMLEVTDLFVLQPYLWKPTTRLVRRGEAIFDRLCLPTQASYVYDIAELPNANTRDLAEQRLRPFFATLLGAIGNTARLHVGYGVHQAVDARIAGKNLAAALARLPGQKKAVSIVPCKLMPFREGVSEVENVRVIDLDQEAEPHTKLEQALASDAVRAIVATTVGALPSALFRQLVVRSQLPVLFEGANTASLLLNAGRPHLSVKLGTTTYATIPGSDGHTKLAELTGLLGKDGLEEDELTRLATFMDKALAGNSEVGTYFTLAQTHLKQDKLDQLKLSLYRLDYQRRLKAGELIEADALPAPRLAQPLFQ